MFMINLRNGEIYVIKLKTFGSFTVGNDLTSVQEGEWRSKITALYDWIFEEAHGAGVVNDFAVMVAKKAVNSFVRTQIGRAHV